MIYHNESFAIDFILAKYNEKENKYEINTFDITITGILESAQVKG
jgi:hypothetical protein